MDHFEARSYNGMDRHEHCDQDGRVEKKRNYKLVEDPMLKTGQQKVYRFDGHNPANPMPIIPTDPRSRLKRFWTKRDSMHLPVPKFKYDQYYVGTILPKEVTFTNLNDNINKQFLKDMCFRFGNIEDCSIFYHPNTKKHLGIGKVLFTSTRAARNCVNKLDSTAKMGNVMTVFLDSMGKERQRLIEEMTGEKQKRDHHHHHHHHHQKGSSSPSKSSRRHSHSKEPSTPRQAHPPVSVTPRSTDTLNTPSNQDSNTPNSGVQTPAASVNNGPAGFLSPPEMVGFMPPGVAPPVKPPPGFTVPPPPLGPPDVPPFPPPIDITQPPPPLPPTHFPPPPHDAFNQFVPNMSCPPPPHMGMQPGPPQAPVPPANVQNLSQSREDPRPQNSHNSQTVKHVEKSSGNRAYRDNGHRKESHRDRESGDWYEREEVDDDMEEDDGWYRDSHGRHKERDRHRDRHKDRYFDDDRDRDSYERDERHRHHRHKHRHKHRKDRHRDRHRDRDRRDHHRHHSPDNDSDTQGSNQHVKEEWHNSPAPPPVVEKEQTPPPSTDSPEQERHMSLESRIQSLLGATGLGASFGSGEDEVASAAETVDTSQGDASSEQPPLPVDDGPPLPPVEDEPPPLPPEPAPHEVNNIVPPLVGTDMGDVLVNSDSNSMWPNTMEAPMETVETENDVAANDDDDRMSLSSLSSGEEKLEVVQVPGTIESYTNFVNNYQNNMLMPNAQGLMPPGGPVYPNFPMDNEQALIHQLKQAVGPQDEQAEEAFLAVLEQVITELKFVMRKDLQKKMVETSAFKSLESWWDTEDCKVKSSLLSPLKSPPLLPGLKMPAFPTAASDTVAPTDDKPPSQQPKKETKDMSETLASLFDRKESSMGGFGMGGLLGIRGGIPKLPSFRRAKFRPATPPEEEEDRVKKEEDSDEEEDDKRFRGPCTPDDSGTEAKEDSSASSDSDSDDDDLRESRRKPLIGSDESDWDSDKPDPSDGESESAVSSDEDEDDESEVSEESEADESDAASSSSAAVSSDDEGAASPAHSRRSSSRASTVSGLSDIDEDEADKHSLASSSAAETRSRTVSPALSVTSSSHAALSEAESKPERMELEDQAEEEKSSVVEEKSSAEEGELTDDEEEADNKMDTESAVTAEGKREDSPEVDVEKMDDDQEKGAEDSLTVDTLHKVEEKDAAMALLEMQSPKQRTPDGSAQPVEQSTRLSEAEMEAEVKKSELTSAQIAMAAEHNYFAPPVDSQDKLGKDKGVSDETDSASEGEAQLVPTLPEDIALDHSYCQPFFPVDTPTYPEDAEPPGWMDQTKGQVPIVETISENFETVAATVEVQAKAKTKTAAKRSRGGKKLTDVTNLEVPRELANLLPPPVKPAPVIQFKSRTLQEEMQVTYEFLFKGIDQEDVEFIRQRYEELLQDDGQQTYWLNDTHWVDHSHTRIPDPVPPKKRRKYSSHEEVVVGHKTGCARTEGYYKISHQEKYGYLKDFCGVLTDKDGQVKVWESTKKKVQISREARSESRRWQNVLQSMGEDVGDLLKFNQLKFRKKNLKFAKSGIHDWGLFALEPIAEGEMVIEYVGAVIRQSVADLREKKYEAMGIGSSYMFRIDHDTIIDATKCGNLARFINHSCNPNCVAKIISVESQKKIVIYSKRDIDMNEEITYDYKFPIEEEKISCMCGEASCRGTLN